MKIPDTVPWVATGRTLGGGGQGTVHLVNRRDHQDNRNYALKILTNTSSRQARARFAQEIEVVKKLDSPFIAKIIDHSAPEDEFQYYTMEYYDGAKSLHEIIFSDQNPFNGDILKCLDLFEKLLSALQVCELSKPQVVHRDITPKNILVLPDQSIRLIDFGLCLIQEGQRVTLVDEDVGTRNYTAPECESGSDLQIGIHSDIYSAGKVLWSCITSRRAFAREKSVFGNLGMLSLFPENPAALHLNPIFEKAIRGNPQNRLSQIAALKRLTQETRRLVEHGFPPWEETANRCPSCGHLGIIGYDQGHNVFGNPNPPGVDACICKTCGFIFLRDMGLFFEKIERFKNLD